MHQIPVDESYWPITSMLKPFFFFNMYSINSVEITCSATDLNVLLVAASVSAECRLFLLLSVLQKIKNILDLTSRVADPDPHGSGMGKISGCLSRIRRDLKQFFLVKNTEVLLCGFGTF
jgi:hypothetical protein